MTARSVATANVAARSARALNAAARVMAVAATFGLARFAADAALHLLVGGESTFDVVGESLGAVVVGATLVALGGRLDGTRPERAAILTLLSFASVLAVLIEGSAFAPSLSPVDRLPVAMTLQLGVSTLAAIVAVVTAPHPSPVGQAPPLAPRQFLAGVGAGAIAYVIAYLVSGALMYLLVTGPYYETHAGGLDTPAPAVVMVVAALEGLLMALATVPLARSMPGSLRSRAITCGVALWALGGVVPLLQQTLLPEVIRVASTVEILFQKVPVGIVIARRFRR